MSALNIGKEIKDMVEGLKLFELAGIKVKKEIKAVGKVFDELIDPNKVGQFRRIQKMQEGKPMVTKEGEPQFAFFRESKLTGKERPATKAEFEKAQTTEEGAFKPGAGIFDFMKDKMAPGMGALGKVAGKVFKPLSRLGDGILKLGGVPKSKLGAVKGAMKSMGGMAMKGAGIMMVLQVLTTLIAAMDPFKPLMEALSEIFGIFGEVLGESMMPLIEKLYEVMLSPTAMSLMEALSDVFMQIVVALLPLVDILAPLATLLMMALVIPLQMLVPIIQLLMIPLGWVATGFQALGIILMGLWNVWLVSGAPIFHAIGSAFAFIANMFTTLLAPAFNVVSNAFNVFTNGLRSIGNSIIDTLNALDFLNVIPDIPRLRTGALIGTATTVTLGEAGPEKVVPLNQDEDLERNALLREMISLQKETIQLARNNGGRIY